MDEASASPEPPGAEEDRSGAELVIGLVTPLGTNTSEVAERVRTALAEWSYRSSLIKVTDYFNRLKPPKPNEYEDERVRRLIDEGNRWCHQHEDAAAVGHLAAMLIRRKRVSLHRSALTDSVTDLSDSELSRREAHRQAFIIHSLKRPAEVTALRGIYMGRFFLIGCQSSRDQCMQNLLSRPLSGSGEEARRQLAAELIATDAEETDEYGQQVNKTYPMADYFLGPDETASRVVNLIFRDPRPAVTSAELAMYLAHATAAKSLSGSRRVGASLVSGDSVVAVGCNEVPAGEEPDLHTGVDLSETMKRELVRDTVLRLRDGGVLSEPLSALDDDEITRNIRDLLTDSQLTSVIEYQRAVHAEAAAISDAAQRGQLTLGTDLYTTTYPCHLCFKQALASGVAAVHYIEPYPKSRAVDMFPANASRLAPYEGVAPDWYRFAFLDRPVWKADTQGTFPFPDKGNAAPAVRDIDFHVISSQEARAIDQLQVHKEETEHDKPDSVH